MSPQKIAAWLVHLYTASGGLVGMFALFAAAEGRISESFLLLLVALIIDGTDGILARRARVREVLPYFDGSMLDNVIDVLTYVWVPVFIMWHENLLPHPIWLAVPVFAALYAYGQSDMKTDDDFFMGFPSYWNVVAFYLFVLPLPDIGAILLVIVPGILTFIPTRYLYPSKNRIYWKTSSLLFVIWTLMILYILLKPHPPLEVVLLSLFYPIFYMALSFYVDWQIRQGNPKYMPDTLDAVPEPV